MNAEEKRTVKQLTIGLILVLSPIIGLLLFALVELALYSVPLLLGFLFVVAVVAFGVYLIETAGHD